MKVNKIQCVGSVSCYEMEALCNFQLLAPVLLLQSDISWHYCITVVLNQESGAHYRVPQQTSQEGLKMTKTFQLLNYY